MSPSELLMRLRVMMESAIPGSLMVQLRDHQLSGRARLQLGRQLRQVTRQTGQLLCVNDRLDLALILGADAVHLGEGSVSTLEARRLVGDLWISRACHDPSSMESEADAILLSPILEARKGRAALGLDALTQARAKLPRPGQRLVALGGVDVYQAASCISAGADAVAAIGATLDGDPALLVEALGMGC